MDFQQFEREIENLAHTSKLQWKKSGGQDVQGGTFQEASIFYVRSSVIYILKVKHFKHLNVHLLN